MLLLNKRRVTGGQVFGQADAQGDGILVAWNNMYSCCGSSRKNATVIYVVEIQ